MRVGNGGLLDARTEPGAGWTLLLAPLLLIALEASPDPTSAMIRLAAILLLGTFAWGMGRGPAGPWAERGFAALLLVAWFAVCGTAFRLHGVPSSAGGRLALTAALLAGPLALLWAWRRRARMVPVVDDLRAVAAAGTAAAAARALALVVAALFVLDRLFALHRADLLVIGTVLVLSAAFRVRGRRQGLGISAELGRAR